MRKETTKENKSSRGPPDGRVSAPAVLLPVTHPKPPDTYKNDRLLNHFDPPSGDDYF